MRTPRADVSSLSKGKITAKTQSFNGRVPTPGPEMIRLPIMVPNLTAAMATVDRPKLTKVLMNVMVQGGFGAVQVLMSPESTVRDLILATLKQYVKERRRPVFHSSRVDEFDLHYSQFSLQSLDREEKIASLGSRNFFMCRRREVADGGRNDGAPVVSCSKEAAKLGGSQCLLFKFISFLF